MTFSTPLVAIALASTLITTTPAFAQHRSSGGRGHSASSGGQARGGAVVRSGSRPVASGGRVYAQSRGAYGVRGSVVAGGPRVAGRAYYARTAPVRFYSPYYAFRPRFNFGCGLWLGYPVAYSAGFYAPYYSYPYYDPYYYGAPYPYPYPYYSPYPYGGPAYGAPSPAYPPNAYPPNGYPPNGYPQNGYPQNGYPQNGYPPSTTPSPGSATPPTRYSNPSSNPNYPASRSVSVDAQRDMGGFSFEVSPSTAQIYVDGQYVGTVGDFTPRSQPLGVQVGHHRVEIRADGYRTMQFDADVVAGEVLPYQGAMQR